jgi:hypothetical protein
MLSTSGQKVAIALVFLGEIVAAALFGVHRWREATARAQARS